MNRYVWMYKHHWLHWLPEVDATTCPHCGVIGSHCVTPSGRPAAVHHPRLVAAVAKSEARKAAR